MGDPIARQMAPVALIIYLSLFSVSAAPTTASLPLARFDGSSQDFSWVEENDPVMGGVSTNCTFKRDKTTQTAIFSGIVQDVPSLKAPGFCFAQSVTPFHHFGDASAFSSYVIDYQSSTAYAGFKAAFLADTLNEQFGAFKADFNVSKTDGFETVSLPFSSFSNKWSSATGEPTEKSPPTAKNLRDISQLQIWAEGVKGPFSLHIKEIRAE